MASGLHRHKRPPTRQEEGQEAPHMRYEPGTFSRWCSLRMSRFGRVEEGLIVAVPRARSFPLLATGELIFRPTSRHTPTHKPQKKPAERSLWWKKKRRFSVKRAPDLQKLESLFCGGRPRFRVYAVPRARAVSSPPSAVPGGRANARGGSPAAPALSSSRRARRAPSTTTARAAPRRRGGRAGSGCRGGTRCRRRRRA